MFKFFSIHMEEIVHAENSQRIREAVDAFAAEYEPLFLK